MSRRLPHVAFWLLLALVLGGVALQYTLKVAKPRKDGATQSAILRWAKQIQAMEDGENIHDTTEYPNAPIMPQMLWPLAELAEVSPVAAALTWFALKVGMALVCWLWCFRLVESPDRPFPAWAKAIAVAVSINPVIGDLKHGNVNLFILFLVTAALYGFSRHRNWLCGILVGLAIACKVTPALFGVYFTWKRAWKTVAGIVVGMVLFFLVVPSLVFAAQERSLSKGWDRNTAALSSWVDKMIKPYLVEGKVWSERENQSLPGVLTRLLGDSPSFSKWVDDEKRTFAQHNVAELSPTAVKRIVQVCQFAFLALMAWTCRTSTRDRVGWRLAAEFSLILVGMLLFSERTWKHHCVTLMLPFAVLCYGAFAGGFTTRVRRTALVTLIVAASCVLLPTVLEAFGDATLFDVGRVDPQAEEVMKLNPNSPRELSQVYGAYLWAFAAILVGLTVMMRGGRSSSEPEA